MTDEEGTVARVKPEDRNAYVMPIDRFHCAIEHSLAVADPTGIYLHRPPGPHGRTQRGGCAAAR